MKSRILLRMGVVLLLAACGAPAENQTSETAEAKEGAGRMPRPAALAEEESPSHDAFHTEAKASTNRLQLELKQELSAAMKEGGPATAVEVCSQRASELTADVSARTGLDVRRVSLRNRNPANRATPGEASVLALMAARPDLADTMIVRDGAPMYMRAIRINTPLCLSCHGPREELAPEVVALLDELYTDDQATGFAEGDLRGAFVVRPAQP